MDDAFQTLLDSGWLFLAFGAVICIFLGIRPARRLFQGANEQSRLIWATDHGAQAADCDSE